jgi:hypothetical protein
MVDVESLIDDVFGKEVFLEEKEKHSGLIFQAPVKQIVIQQSESGGNILMKKNVTQERVIRIGDKTLISAPIVIADTIENSFNALAQSDVNADIKTLLGHLLEAVNEVNKTASSVEAEDAEAMARDAETLVKEATSSKPRQQWYKISIEGLKQAAINIGEIAKPVLDIVEKLVPLLISQQDK